MIELLCTRNNQQIEDIKARYKKGRDCQYACVMQIQNLDKFSLHTHTCNSSLEGATELKYHHCAPL